MRYSSSNYLTQVIPEKLRLIPVSEFLKDPPLLGFGFVYKVQQGLGFIDDEFTVDATCLQNVPMDATHVVWFEGNQHVKQAYTDRLIDPDAPRKPE